MTRRPAKSPEAEGELSADTSAIAAPVYQASRQGFLPIETNTFDRIFISVVCLVTIHLLWLRFVEVYFPLWIATVLTLILSLVIIRWG